MTQPSPFAGISRLLIDGNNLLHRTSGSAGPAQVRLLLAQLRQVLPPAVAVTLMLDGHPAPGTSRTEKVSANLEIRHAGSLTADDALIGLVNAEPPHARAGTVLVSDDRALVERARTIGARTQRLAWLERLLASAGAHSGNRAGSTGIGAGRRPPQPRQAPADEAKDSVDERPSWQPGRGATRKRGNPRRRPRSGL